MLPINGRSTAELTPGNIRHFNKQKEDESKGMSNLINIQEAPKAYSQARSHGMDQLLKSKNGHRQDPAALQSNGKEPEIGRSYQKNMLKLQGSRRIRDKLRKEMWYMYRSAENAFAELDFTGLGYVTEKAFLESYLVKNRIPFTEEEIKLFFKEYNLFGKNSKGMLMDEFKKNFFPHLYLVQEEPDDVEENEALENKMELIKNKAKQP
jgi:hypothetical protein